MIKKSVIAAILLAVPMALAGAQAQAAQAEGTHAEQLSWSFAGPFGTYDTNQLRRGFQVFKEVCASCHSADMLAFRNLEQPGGPEYSAAQVKALAATYTIADETAQGGERPGVPSDYWPAPFASEQDARDANGGALPPDMSVLAKARGIHQPFPYWLFNYFTTYQESGTDYIYNLLTSYTDAPADFKLPDGKYYNAFFSGHAISMPPPLSDGLVSYEGEGVPQTTEQYAKDVAAYLTWVSDPGLDGRKEAGFRVILFLILFAGLMYLTKRKLWANVEH
ncbi:MAG TPA: cytochrome c1 [Devosiaceae bacterium]